MSLNLKTPEEILQTIANLDHFLVTAHIRADGDAIASLCFMIRVLNRLNKTYYSGLHDDTPDEKYAFLPHFEEVSGIGKLPRGFKPRATIILDTPNFERLGDVASHVDTDKPIINIDHHSSNHGLGGIDLVDAHASSTCEILVDIGRLIPDFMNRETAEILYTGICFDTGRFRFSNTTPKAMRIAAELLEYGVNPRKIAERLFFDWSELRVRAMARALSSLELLKNGTVAVLRLDYDFFKAHPNGWVELEGFSDMGAAIRGVEVSLFFKEFAPNRYKISLRAKGSCNVGEAAEKLGGGGHPKAAGCSFDGSFEEALDAVLTALDTTSETSQE